MKLHTCLLGALACTALLMTGAVQADDAIETINPYHVRYGLTYESGFERMGFGFAPPVITLLPGYHTDHVYRPAMVVPAGYDPTKDYRGPYDEHAWGDTVVRGRGPSDTGERMEDKIGNAIYFMDAVRGDLIARIRGETTLPKDGNGVQISEAAFTSEIVSADMKHSIPAGITPIDTTGDGLTDRIYFIDVIGNIWRVDLNPRDSAASPLTQNWILTKLAELGTDGVLGVLGDSSYAQNDRRFFQAIDVVRTRRGDGTPVDALMIGSGDIADPKETTVVNGFFMIYDPFVTRLREAPSGWSPIRLDDLDEVTDDATEVGEDKLGWYMPLPGLGEKVMSAAVTVDGITHFTTITPSGGVDKGCSPPTTLPDSKVYAVNISTPELVSGTTLGGSGYTFQQVDPYVGVDGKVSIILTDEDSVTPDASRRLHGKDRAWHSQGQ